MGTNLAMSRMAVLFKTVERFAGTLCSSDQRTNARSLLVNLPDVVSFAEWQAARDRLLVKEKAATRALDDEATA
jgi:hypothetical protein